MKDTTESYEYKPPIVAIGPLRPNQELPRDFDIREAFRYKHWNEKGEGIATDITEWIEANLDLYREAIHEHARVGSWELMTTLSKILQSNIDLDCLPALGEVLEESVQMSANLIRDGIFPPDVPDVIVEDPRITRARKALAEPQKAPLELTSATLCHVATPAIAIEVSAALSCKLVLSPSHKVLDQTPRKLVVTSQVLVMSNPMDTAEADISINRGLPDARVEANAKARVLKDKAKRKSKRKRKRRRKYRPSPVLVAAIKVASELLSEIARVSPSVLKPPTSFLRTVRYIEKRRAYRMLLRPNIPYVIEEPVFSTLPESA